MAEKTVPLSQSYTAHKTTFDSLTFREPTWAEYSEIGPVHEWQRSETGPVFLTYHDKIATYVKRTIVPPHGGTGAAMLAVLNLADMMKASEAVEAFYASGTVEQAADILLWRAGKGIGDVGSLSFSAIINMAHRYVAYLGR